MADESADFIESAPKFEVDQEWRENHLSNNYNSDEYYELKEISEDLHSVVVSEIFTREQFASLRPIWMKGVQIGQEVKILNQKKGTVKSKLDDNKYVVQLQDGSEHKVDPMNMDEVIDPIIRLKKLELLNLYNLCFSTLTLKRKKKPDIINFFSEFVRYFSVQERYLFACLDLKTMGNLLDEIQARGYKIDRAINPLFRSNKDEL